MPIVYVRDKNSREVIKVEEKFSSLVWTERYQEAGDFVLDIPLNEANFDVYTRGNYVQLDESDDIMVIESLNIDDQMDDKVLEVSGRSMSCILERRINASRILDNYAQSIKYQGTIASVVGSIINDEIITPKLQKYKWQHNNEEGQTVDGYNRVSPTANFKTKYTVDAPQRKISNFSYSDLVGGGVSVDKNYSKLMTIYDILVSISKKCVTGFRVRFQNGSFILETYKGVDRTSAQKVLDPVIFNPVMDNISYVNYFEDQTNFKNVALSYSDAAWSPVDFNASFLPEDPDDDPPIFDGYVWVTDKDTNYDTGLTGLDRYELPVDARSSASVSSWDPSDYYYPEMGEEQDPTEYIVDKVEAVAEDEFDTGDHDFVKISEGSIDPLVRYDFGVDYFLGDTVELSNDNGVIMTAIIDEVVRSYDQSGFIVTPNFKSMEDYDYGSEGDDEEDEDTSGEEETA